MKSLFLNMSLSILTLLSYAIKAQTPNESVKIRGAMKNVMKDGQLGGTILLDTIHDKTAL